MGWAGINLSEHVVEPFRLFSRARNPELMENAKIEKRGVGSICRAGGNEVKDETRRRMLWKNFRRC